MVSSEGELKATPAAPPPKPSVVLAQSQAAGMPPAKKPKLYPQSSTTSAGAGSGQQSSSGGLFSNPIRVTQQSTQSSLPASNRPGKMPSKSGVPSLTPSQLTPMDSEAILVLIIY